MGINNPLYLKIMAGVAIGQQISVQYVASHFNYTDGHTRRVMNWMSGQQQPPTLRKIPNTSPTMWVRI